MFRFPDSLRQQCSKDFISLKELQERFEPSRLDREESLHQLQSIFERVMISRQLFEPNASGEVGVFAFHRLCPSDKASDMSALMAQLSICDSKPSALLVAFRTDAFCRSRPELKFFSCPEIPMDGSNPMGHAASSHVAQGTSFSGVVNYVTTEAVKMYCGSETARAVTSTTAGIAVAGALLGTPATVVAAMEAGAIAVVVEKTVTNIINNACDPKKEAEKPKVDPPKEENPPKSEEPKPKDDPKKSFEGAPGNDCGLKGGPSKRFSDKPSQGPRFTSSTSNMQDAYCGTRPKQPPLGKEGDPTTHINDDDHCGTRLKQPSLGKDVALTTDIKDDDRCGTGIKKPPITEGGESAIKHGLSHSAVLPSSFSLGWSAYGQSARSDFPSFSGRF